MIAAALLWLVWRSRQHPPQLTEIPLTENGLEAPVLDAAISPNGNFLAYADVSGLYLKEIGSGQVHALFTPTDARIWRIAWFPDSSSLLFISISTQNAQRQLWSGSMFGGTPRLLRRIPTGKTPENYFPRKGFTSISRPGMQGGEGSSTSPKEGMLPSGPSVLSNRWTWKQASL